jgi:hypothetical protein
VVITVRRYLVDKDWQGVQPGLGAPHLQIKTE